MTRASILIACGVAFGAAPGIRSTAEPAATSQSAACERLTALSTNGTRIASAAQVPAGPLAVGRGSIALPAMCRVLAVATPTPDSHINVEVWMPSTSWNGKLLGTGNGGFAGAIGYAAMAEGLNRGYAVVGTDTGHSGDQLTFGLGHPEKIVDWAHRAVHEMTGIAKLVVRNHYGRVQDRSYFAGCSTGGQQALSEAQRYPDDYDGIVAGNPGNNRVRLILGFLWSWLATHAPDGSAVLPSSKLAALGKAAVEACDVRDGLQDGLIADPRACTFDPVALACTGAETASCLTPPQVDAVRKVYAGATNPRTGAQIFPGWARGSESGWRTYITEPRAPVRVGFFDWAFENPAWDMRSFDWDRDVASVEVKFPFLSAVDTDLTAFRRRGGRLIMYTGLADPVVPPQDVIDYYEAVASTMGGLDATRDFFRFFAAPGMAHCGGGAGPNTFDSLATLESWVERGDVPSSMLATHSTGGLVDRSRPLCAYPERARYIGTGSVDEAASFACVTPAP